MGGAAGLDRIAGHATAAGPRQSARRPSSGDDRRRRHPPTRQHDLLRLPLGLDHELLRLPSLAAREREEADAAQRGRREPQLDELQLPDAARRHLLPGKDGGRSTRRSRDRRRARSACARHWRLLAEPEPRVDLLAAADGLRRRLRRHGVLDLRPAHGARQGDAKLHRLPRLGRPTTTTPGWPSC